ncbi:MAG: hypothetical protein LC808_04660 [Actinobacteria bacterium]|nr:hypothetical protein [Actinomycetota bacterium]
MHTPGNLRRLITWYEDRLFAGEDAAARRRGWHISRPPTGSGRVYRDPRWDLLTECEQCGGEGGSAVDLCRSCQGQGTVRHSPTDAHPGDMS